jgi:hypothetical protein
LTQFPHKSQELEIHDPKKKKKISRGFTKNGNAQSESVARIYLAKQDKVVRNRKGKEEYFCLTHKKWEPGGSKWQSLFQEYTYLFKLGDSNLNLHIDLWSPSNHQSFH